VTTTAHARLLSGTVTFVFTDIEGSTRLLKALRGDYGRVLGEHAEVVRGAFGQHGGREVDTQGDSFFYVFRRARDAVAGAADAQRSLAAHPWPGDRPVRVRMGVHTGEPERLGDERYVGLDVHRAARICTAAHGGQVVLSHITAALAEDELPAGVALKPLGHHRLKDLDRPERLVQLVVAGLRDRFPPLRSAAQEPFADAHDALAAGLALEREPGGAVSVALLGPVEARRGGELVAIAPLTQRMLLAQLALRAGEAVPAEQLVETLWGERPPAGAEDAVRADVDELRAALQPAGAAGGAPVIVRQPPGYTLVLPDDAVDVARFQALWEQGRRSLAERRFEHASGRLADALALVRGPGLADLRHQPAFELESARLDEAVLACREDHVESQLGFGRHAEVVPELERLVREHPLRERLAGQLMLALHRSGRRADALAAFRRTRDALASQLGIDPSASLHALERGIARGDPALDAPAPAGKRPATAAIAEITHAATVVLASQASADVDGLVELVRPLVASGERDLVLARILSPLPGREITAALREVTRRLSERRDRLQQEGIRARVAAFSSERPGTDIVKLATHQDADLLFLDGTRALLEDRRGISDELLVDAPCDVVLHLPKPDGGPRGDAFLCPFGGSEHDWAALELAALYARHTGAPIVVAGAEDSAAGDASRLLANASLVIQRTTGIVAEPLLIPRGPAGVLEAAADARLIVIGVSPRYRQRGLGETRYAIARQASTPSLFVRRGTRPGVLAPKHSMTRHSWSLPSHAG
jgi:DNA-binding SARP family transcriptional activator/class 3 adenylate cyclase